MEYTAFVTLPMNGQISVGPAIFPAFGTIGKIAAVIMFEVAVVPEAQIVLAVMKQLIWLLLISVVVIKVAAFAPLTFTPFLLHW